MIPRVVPYLVGDFELRSRRLDAQITMVGQSESSRSATNDFMVCGIRRSKPQLSWRIRSVEQFSCA